MKTVIRQEIALPVGLLTLLFFKTLGSDLLTETTPLGIYLPVSAALLAIVTWAIFSVVRHSDALAIKLGEPFGTLILTLSVISLEVVMISSVMLTGEPNPTMARDTMFAVVMLVSTGLVGFTLLFGGWRYHTQSFNLDGVKSYLVAIIPLALLCLVLPNFTRGRCTVGSMSSAMSWMLIIISILLYGVFLLIQTRSHSHFFVDSDHEDYEEHHGPLQNNIYHTLLLLAYLLVVILLAKTLAVPINFGVNDHGRAPPALGGFIVACIVLAPEAVGAIKAAFNNQLQRAMNLYFGSVLATIALTVPAVLFIGAMLGQEVRLGLSAADMVLLVTTLMVCKVTFSSGRTNVLHGATHLVLFVVYLFLMFEHE